ncbi:piggyBac transposable element-derived protein 4-like [Actinia tenebrosa]|uniref:PiggyBac transposable element-derived protein 4-like n=1 Tax=Actinia tenebrosa TaxID=6105 RepID=A0A6P8I4L9_ACTTE|nr:piggyBac transposable element-derived protein 4-like [Actinia tenebrosa]
MRPAVTKEEFRAIFGDSDDEDRVEDEDESNIDLDGLRPVSDLSEGEESDSEESEAEGEVDEELWMEELSNFTLPGFSSFSALLIDLGNNPKDNNLFFEIFGEKNLQLIVLETNRYARQQLVSKPDQLACWKDTTAVETKTHFGLCIIMGSNVLPAVANYWSTAPCLGNQAVKSVVRRNRFQEISQFLHFNDSMKAPPCGDANCDLLFKVRPVLKKVLENTQRYYLPKKNIAVHEGIIAFRGRPSFRQYMPAKPTKYSIKVWMANDSSKGYVLNFEIYMGSEAEKRVHGLCYQVVMNMVKPFLKKNHDICFDNNQTTRRACSSTERQDCFYQMARQVSWSFLLTNISHDQPSRTVQRVKKGRNIEIEKPHVSNTKNSE